MRETQRRDGEEDMGRRLERREEQRSRGRRSREFFVREKAFRERDSVGSFFSCVYSAE